MSTAKLDEIITSLTNTSGSFDDYAKRVKSIIAALNTSKKIERELNTLTEKNKKLIDENYKAEKQLKDCNEVRNKTDYVKMKQDFEEAISNKESQVLALKEENRNLKLDVKAARAKTVEMVPITKKGGKSRKHRKSRKSKRTRRVYSLDPI